MRNVDLLRRIPSSSLPLEQLVGNWVLLRSAGPIAASSSGKSAAPLSTPRTRKSHLFPRYRLGPHPHTDSRLRRSRCPIIVAHSGQTSWPEVAGNHLSPPLSSGPRGLRQLLDPNGSSNERCEAGRNGTARASPRRRDIDSSCQLDRLACFGHLGRDGPGCLT